MHAGMRVLYMGENAWQICKVEKRIRFNVFLLKPENLDYMEFVAPVSRCIEIPEHVKTIEQVVDMLRRMENWNENPQG